MLQVGPRSVNLLREFSAAVDDCHNVLQIVARTEIILAASMERFQLGREEVRGSDELNLKFTDPDSLRIFEPGSIPGVAEAENRRVCRHQIENQFPAGPPTNRVAVGVGMPEAQIAHPGFQLCELGI